MATTTMDDTLRWLKSAAALSIILTIVIAVAATIDRGPYILVNTIVTGGMLSLMAMGLALVFGVMNIPFFCHGEFFMIGTLVAYFIFTPMAPYINQNPGTATAFILPFVAIFGAGIGAAILGILAEKMVFGPLRKRSQDNWVMNAFLLTVGVAVVMINMHQLLFKADFKGIVRYWGGPPINVMDVFISRDRAWAFILAMAICLLFWAFMSFTRTGRAIRAVSQDETGAEIVGVDLKGILLLTMALSTALAGVAGASLLFMYPSYPTVGLEPLYMAWFVVIIAGLGNVLGAMAGAFMVALLKVLTVEYVGSGWEFVIPSILIVIVLIFKPSGLFGTEVRGVMDK